MLRYDHEWFALTQIEFSESTEIAWPSVKTHRCVLFTPSSGKKFFPSPARQIMTAENYPSKWRAVIVKLLFIFTILQATIEICRPRVVLVLGFLENLVARTRSNGKGSFSLIFKCTAVGQFLDASEAVRVHDALNRQ